MACVPSSVRALLAATGALFALLTPSGAHAWVETHVVRDDVAIDVSADGSGRVEHRVVLRVAGGPLPSIDLRGVDVDASPEQGALVVPERAAQKKSLEGAEPVTVELVTPKAREGGVSGPVLRLRFAGRGLGRGSYVVTARYRTDLRGRGALTLDGAQGNLIWRGAVLPDGLDAARLSVTLPAGTTPPAAASDGSEGEGAPIVLSTVARVGTSDRIELVRPYAPKEEPVTWRVRFDARALGGEVPGAARPAGPAELGRRLAAAPRAVLSTALFVAGGAVALVLALLALLKTMDVRRSAAARHAVARPLLPMPAAVRVLAFTGSFVGGAALVGVHGRVVAGSCCLLLAALLSWFRPGKLLRAPLRPGGKWLVVSEGEATARPRLELGSPVDASTPLGLVVLAAVFGAVALGLFKLREHAPYHTLLLALGATALLPLFLTGRRDQLPPDTLLAGRELLRDVAQRAMRLLRPHGARLVGRMHVPTHGGDPDELRLALVPRARPSGLATIDLAIGFAEVGGGWARVPEILVRVRPGSPTDELLRERFDGVAHDRGERRDGERVVSFTARIPSARAVADLWVAIFVALTGDAGHAARPASPASDRVAQTPPRRPRRREQAPIPVEVTASSELSQAVGSS